MEMQQLRYVVAVARTGNFSRAAEQCRVAQPSLSQQIQKLEDGLGVPLVFAGATKIAYDLLLWREFRRVQPPEERLAA